MPIKLDSLIINNNFINKMRQELDNSYKTHLENGFSLCTEPNSNIIVGRGHCTGDNCKIHLPRKCEQDEKFIGSFHTHPGGSSRISSADMMTSCIETVSCIGGDNYDIKCYIRKKSQPEWRDMAQQLVCHYEAEEFHTNYDIPMNKRFDDIKLNSNRLKNLVNTLVKDPMNPTIDKKELRKQILTHNNNIKQFTKDSIKLEANLEKLVDNYFNLKDIY